MASIDLLKTTEAGVSRVHSNPFASMEINDQVDGENGIVTGTGTTGATALRSKGRVLFEAGVVRTPFEATQSIVGR